VYPAAGVESTAAVRRSRTPRGRSGPPCGHTPTPARWRYRAPRCRGGPTRPVLRRPAGNRGAGAPPRVPG